MRALCVHRVQPRGETTKTVTQGEGVKVSIGGDTRVVRVCATLCVLCVHMRVFRVVYAVCVKVLLGDTKRVRVRGFVLQRGGGKGRRRKGSRVVAMVSQGTRVR